jgi:hypothetical protein
MFKLTRKAAKVQNLIGAVSIRNARPIILQSLFNPKMIPVAIAYDRIGLNLRDFGFCGRPQTSGPDVSQLFPR